MLTEMADIERILRSGRDCQLAFTAEPAPYIVTLNYGYADGALYFHSAGEGRKIELAQSPAAVGFSVSINLGIIEGESGCNWSTRYQSVVGYGRIRFLETAEEKRRGLDIIMAQYSPGRFSYPDKTLAATSVYKLVISEMTAKQSQVDN